MSNDTLDYDFLVKDALRNVMRTALKQVAEHGLPRGHHFYITFQTGHDGVDIPDHLYTAHPDEMTIVLQYQFWDLTVDETAFSITLSFNKNPENLRIPFDAVTAFSDPPAKFGLQFQQVLKSDITEIKAADSGKQPSEPGEESGEDNDKGKDGDSAEVISLDAFRKPGEIA